MSRLNTPQAVLQRFFGHETFRGVQLTIIEHLLRDQHALVIMPTGMGKSLCFQIPAILRATATHDASDSRKPLTLVISPLIALMKDQVDSLNERGIAAAYINSSLDRLAREARHVAVADGQYDLLYVTPERFRKQSFRDVLQKRHITLLAVDEAHCISEWGHDFRPDYSRLSDIRNSLGDPTTVALTATATPEVQRDIIAQLGVQPDKMRLFHEGIDRPNLTLDVIPVWGVDEKIEHILRIGQQCPGAGIVYFTLIKTLMEFSEHLLDRNVRHLIYHGELPSRERRRIQERFMNEKDWLVLATNAFGMGVDKEDIRSVIHSDLPGSMESYYQEIGRAGRDGHPANCTLLYEEADLATQIQFIEWSNPSAEYYRRVYDFLKHDKEQVDAYGEEWLRDQLTRKNRKDFRLDTTLAMLERWGVIEGSLRPLRVQVIDELPEAVINQDQLDQKLARDQKRLYSLVQYAKCSGDRKDFIHDYFGCPPKPAY